jgi:hypothetical protein
MEESTCCDRPGEQTPMLCIVKGYFLFFCKEHDRPRWRVAGKKKKKDWQNYRKYSEQALKTGN